MNDLLEKIHTSATVPDDKASDYLERKQDFVIKDDVVYPEPEYLINFGGTPTMPKGNIVALSAKWKNGKTFFCDIISGIFLGSQRFQGLATMQPQGRVQIFDTEQAVSDTARIRNIIKKLTMGRRNDDFEVFCLRNAIIDSMGDDDEEISRYDFIVQSIEHYRPDLVIIDGIADLIYNYNDVIESQNVVNNLASLANRMNCCIVVVMHQNKGKQDKSMKGHLGTMLFQKCSDVFNIERVGDLFIVTHAVSRHRQCSDFVFKIDSDGVPMDASEDRQMAVEMQRQQENSKLISMFNSCLDPEKTYKRGEIARELVESGEVKLAHAYRLINQAIELQLLVSEDGRHFKFSHFSTI